MIRIDNEYHCVVIVGIIYMLIIAAMFVATAAIGAGAITVCQERQGSGGHWAYRKIEGRTCWYRGETGRDKSLLRWDHQPDAPIVAVEETGAVEPDADPGLFELTWRDAMVDLVPLEWRDATPAEEWRHRLTGGK